MSIYEVIKDADGEPLASVCVTEALTDDERAVLVEYFTWMRRQRITVEHIAGSKETDQP